MINKKILAAVLCAALTLPAAVSCGKDIDISEGSSVEATTEATAPAEVELMNFTAPKEGDTIIEMNIRDYGTVKFRLFPEYADKGCENFVELAKKGYYDGLTFHRVISGFMIQGGDPRGTGTGGPGYCIKGEFRQNGFDNKLRHDRGVLSMARAMDPDSAGSQFFIMHAPAPYLDGAYAAFGKVTDGMEVVDSIAAARTDFGDCPLEVQRIKTVTVETFGEEYSAPEIC
jgi:peptidyl-prolyl cis-trans isomerase B (cyclophilin B)